LDAALTGQVAGAEFRATCEFDSGGVKTVRPLESVPVAVANTFSPFEPLQKYPPLRPGHAWRASVIDPVGELLSAAGPVVAGLTGDRLADPRPGRRPPAEVVARVQDRTEELVTPRGQPRTCRVIVFAADEVIARTWVDVADGKVWRQEANGLGETVAFVRD
jgi:hypothetical protein